jgi:hypothetical protein
MVAKNSAFDCLDELLRLRAGLTPDAVAIAASGRAHFTSSAALAGMIRMLRKGELPPKDTVLVNSTGRDRQPTGQPQRVHWLRAAGDGWEPEDPHDEATRLLWYAPPAGSSPAGQRGKHQRRPMEDPAQ